MSLSDLIKHPTWQHISWHRTPQGIKNNLRDRPNRLYDQSTELSDEQYRYLIEGTMVGQGQVRYRVYRKGRE